MAPCIAVPTVPATAACAALPIGCEPVDDDLAALDRKIPESVIMRVLGVGRTAIWRTRAAYLEGGLEYALSDVQRPGQPKRYRAPEEAQVTALAYSSPPAGAKRWTVALLTQQARRHPTMRRISRESIRRLLKKTSSNPGAK